MNAMPWVRQFQHPYTKIKATAGTHGHLRPTQIKVPEYSTFAVPFAWMLRERAAELEPTDPGHFFVVEAAVDVEQRRR
ncbi:hypothetical protein [Micromonospora sp. LOL_023]|uniref:hypothetical protein n=1 Tax=Micromonospora sp. LOL_023 TaxID=3345418 RepID=UPI003A863FDB